MGLTAFGNQKKEETAKEMLCRKLSLVVHFHEFVGECKQIAFY